MSDPGNLEARLAALEGRARGGAVRRRPSGRAALGGTAAILAAGALAYIAVRGDPDVPMPTATPDEFQSEGDGFGDVEPVAPPPAPETGVVVVDPQEPNAELLARIAALQAEIEALREAGTPVAVDDSAAEAALEALTAQVAALQASSERAQREVQDALAARDRALDELRTELELAELEDGPDPELERQLRELRSQIADLQSAPGGPSEEDRLEQERLRLLREEDERRLADLERRRAEEAAFQQARIASPAIAFGRSGGGGEELAERTFEDATDFVLNGALPAPVTRGEVIANPSHTIVQGTMIQAAMETAISSELPGQVRAVVSEDVHAYDGSRVLIPRGAKLIGRYRAGAEIAQSRITVAWDRIVLPGNRTIVLSAFGGDALGRSGTTGDVDTRFDERFGSAFLVSLLNALPGAAAARLEDEEGAALLEDASGDLADSTGGAIDDFLAIGPVIHVAQGARITVMVDRDLEIF